MENTSVAMSEAVISLFSQLGIPETHSTKSLERLSSVDSRYIRDLKLNVAAVLKSKNLTPKEAALLSLAVAVNEKNETLIIAFENMCSKEGATQEEMADAHACASLLSLNNVLYRFRHYMQGNETYSNTPAGVRMSVMMNPVVGKEFFELMSLLVSALNGCEQCVTSHENSVKGLGTSEARIFDTIRLASVMKSLCVVV